MYFLLLSGDHSIAIGSVSGTKMAFPNERIGVVWIDAHADLHSPWTTPSGNVHGMPLALLMNIEMKGQNRPVFTLDVWDRLRKMGSSGPKVLPQDAFSSACATLKKRKKPSLRSTRSR